MINIKLYGTPTSNYEYIKSVLHYKMHELGIEMNFVEIQSWEDYIKSNIQSIPSVEINENIIFNIPQNNINNSINTIIAYIKNETMKTYHKNILVPMEFDSASINALKYVIDRFPDSTLTVIHVFSGLLDLNDPLTIVPATPREDALKNSLITYIKEALKGQWPEQIENVEIISGIPSNSILKYSADKLFNLIALGAREKYDLIAKWFGSTATNVLKNSYTPVLVIPKDAQYQSIPSNPIIALEEEEINARSSEIMTKIFDKTTHCHILHITDDEDNSKLEEQEIIMNLETSQFPYRYSVSVQKDKNITEAILNEADKKNASEIIVFPESNSIFKQFLSKNISRNLIYKATKIPVWSFHKTTENK